ncbi:MAG: hypothetical protein DCC71_20915, partial [Proteobacteria bacterium]
MGAVRESTMAKIRAYKIAEELGIDRNELVERAKSLGIDVPSPMASLDEDVAAALRDKLGGHAPGAQVVERRVESQGGAAVIRRRKRAPEPVAVPEPAPVEPVVAEPAPVVAHEPAPEPEPAFEVTGAEPEPAPEPEPEIEPEEIEAESEPATAAAGPR